MFAVLLIFTADYACIMCAKFILPGVTKNRPLRGHLPLRRLDAGMALKIRYIYTVIYLFRYDGYIHCLVIVTGQRWGLNKQTRAHT